MSVFSFIGFVGLVLLIFAITYAKGYNDGVRDTEKRWSDAVKRAGLK
jgi:hypothetical protein